jgi:hypothetical protein
VIRFTRVPMSESGQTGLCRLRQNCTLTSTSAGTGDANFHCFPDFYCGHLFLGCRIQQRQARRWRAQHGAIDAAQHRALAPARSPDPSCRSAPRTAPPGGGGVLGGTGGYRAGHSRGVTHRGNGRLRSWFLQLLLKPSNGPAHASFARQRRSHGVEVPMLRRFETAVTSCAGANGFSSKMLLGTPRDAQRPTAAPVM